MKFAHYDFKKQKIIFREPEEILLDYYKEKNLKFPEKSVAEQLEEKLKTCEAKVIAKIEAINEQYSKLKSSINNEESEPKQSPPIHYSKLKPPPVKRESELEKALKEQQAKLKPPPSEDFLPRPPIDKDKKRKRRDDGYMQHAVMYAAPPSLLCLEKR